MDRLVPLLQKRKHTLIGPAPTAYYGNFLIKCEEHGGIHKTNFYNYNKSAHGMHCCGHAAGALKRIIKGTSSVGRPNPEWKRNAKYNKWRCTTLANNSGRCRLTGLKIDLEVHHIYGGGTEDFKSLRYSTKNGLVLWRAIHRDYHSWLGWRSAATYESFDEYLQYLEKLRSNDEWPFELEVMENAIPETRKWLSERNKELIQLLDSASEDPNPPSNETTSIDESSP